MLGGVFPGDMPESQARELIEAEPGMAGRDLACEVTPAEPVILDPDNPGPRVVAIDTGIKDSIVRNLRERGVRLELHPCSTSSDELLARNPDAVFLANGPGDPAALDYVVGTVRELVGEVPVFGICLGHQLLAAALGGTTVKLPFGHHGGNHPVRRLVDGSVEITSQNHNFAVAEGSVPGAEVTHVNLNDGVIEGIRATDVPAFSVQHHPEAGPGPHDAAYLFVEFEQLMARSRRR
jgi:carbamoyl-phosphate synthase small subunit